MDLGVLETASRKHEVARVRRQLGVDPSELDVGEVVALHSLLELAVDEADLRQDVLGLGLLRLNLCRVGGCAPHGQENRRDRKQECRRILSQLNFSGSPNDQPNAPPGRRPTSQGRHPSSPSGRSQRGTERKAGISASGRGTHKLVLCYGPRPRAEGNAKRGCAAPRPVCGTLRDGPVECGRRLAGRVAHCTLGVARARALRARVGVGERSLDDRLARPPTSRPGGGAGLGAPRTALGNRRHARVADEPRQPCAGAVRGRRHRPARDPARRRLARRGDAQAWTRSSARRARAGRFATRPGPHAGPSRHARGRSASRRRGSHPSRLRPARTPPRSKRPWRESARTSPSSPGKPAPPAPPWRNVRRRPPSAARRPWLRRAPIRSTRRR